MINSRIFKFITLAVFVGTSVDLYAPPRGLFGQAVSRAMTARVDKQVCGPEYYAKAIFTLKDPTVELKRATEKSTFNFCEEFISGLVFPEKTTIDSYIENIKEKLISLIDSAEKYIFASIYSISEPSIVQAFVKAVGRGVSVLMVVDRHSIQHSKGALAYLIKNGVFVYNPKSKTMHRKSLMVDCSKVWTGSFNWTVNASKRNYEEAILANGNKEFICRNSIEFCKLLCNSTRLEISEVRTIEGSSCQTIEIDDIESFDAESE